MIRYTGFLMCVAVACMWPALAQDANKAPEPKPSAKEMFLNPRQMAYGAQDEEAPPAKPKIKATSKTSLQAQKPKVKPSQKADAVAEEPTPAAAKTSLPVAAAPLVSTVQPVATVQPVTTVQPVNTAQPMASEPSTGERSLPIVRASYSNLPLGLRYTLQKKTSEGPVDVSADTEFHSGDRIRLNVEVNDSGYLYIISKGTSGAWTPLFPSPEIENGDNRVQKGRIYSVPPGHVFTFSGKPGVERLFVIFSRQPVDEIDSLIYSLKGGARPVANPGGERPAAESLMADARLDDSRIAQLREVYSRDLIIEKADQEQTSEPQGSQQRDRSVYVVNPNGSADSRVVADIPLIHK